MSAALGLRRIQDVDRQIDRLRNELDILSAKLDDDTMAQEARARQARAIDSYAKASAALESAEKTTAAHQTKIEQVEASLYGGSVKNPKELQELQAELTSLRRQLSALEERQLQSMSAAEAADRAARTATQEAGQLEEEVELARKRLRQERDKAVAQLQRLTVEREAAGQDLPARQLLEYERLRREKRGVAVADVLDEACSACGSALGAAIQQAARSTQTLVRCPTCGRILYGA